MENLLKDGTIPRHCERRAKVQKRAKVTLLDRQDGHRRIVNMVVRKGTKAKAAGLIGSPAVLKMMDEGLTMKTATRKKTKKTTDPCFQKHRVNQNILPVQQFQNCKTWSFERVSALLITI